MTSRVLLLSSEPIGPRLAGPAIRTLELGGVLVRAGHRPIVAAPGVDDDAPAVAFPVVPFEKERAERVLGPLLADVDVVLVHPHALFQFPFISRTSRPLVVDLYDPVLFESLELGAGQSSARRAFAARTQVAILRGLLRRGDLFLCASERQRDLWLGALVMAGRVAAILTPTSTEPGGVFEVVPFGIPAVSPRASPTTTSPLKGAGAIGHSDKVILWGGGMWEWLDPLTLVRAFARVAARRDDVHLAFLGTTPPNDPAPAARMLSETRALAASLGLAARRIHFREGWVPYAERGAALLEADVGVSAHRQHLEARFAFRTRVLDYVWAGLPIVCTRGDVVAELVERERLGIAVPERDEVVLAAALERMLVDDAFVAACRDGLRQIAPRLRWDEVAKPLVRFCESPRIAPDRGRRDVRALFDHGSVRAGRARELLLEGGPRALARQIWRRLRLRH